MNTQLLIDAVVQQTMVFIAQLATSGGVRAPLVHVANQVFIDLTRELQNQGVKKKVIADMFGMALRTYHRRVGELGRSRTDAGQTLWEVVVAFLRDNEPVSAGEVLRRFRRDDPEVLTGVLNDLVGSGLAYRSGRGDGAVYRLADEADFAKSGSRREANEHLVWLTVYRHGPIDRARVAELSRLSAPSCADALSSLAADGRVEERADGEYVADRFEVPLGTEQGWEAAVLDHFQALVSAISAKLAAGSSRARGDDTVGGSTWSLDVWQGHPLAQEARGTLSRIRGMVEDLRSRVDAHNAQHEHTGAKERVVFYMGQYVRTEPAAGSEENSDASNDA